MSSLSEPQHEQPQSTGEIITASIAVLRRRLPLLFALAVPICGLDLVVREVAMAPLSGLSLKDLQIERLLAMAPRFGLSMVMFLVSFALQQVLSGAVTAVAADDVKGRSSSVLDVLQRLTSRLPTVLGAAALFITAGLVVIALALAVPFGAAVALTLGLGVDPLLPSVFAVVVAVGVGGVTLLVLVLRWWLFGAVAMLEEQHGPVGALRRAAALSAARGLPFLETPRFRLSVLLLIALGLSTVLQTLFVGPRLVVALLTGWTLFDGALPGLAQLPLYFAVPFGLVEVVTNAVVLPLSAILVALFAVDLKLRYEPAALPAERA
jgi:hypothetical protein